MIVLGERLRKLRERLLLSQKHMAELLGISRLSYIKYENEDRQPNAATVKKIAPIIGKVVDLILEKKYSSPVSLTYNERFERLKRLLNGDS